MGLTVLECSWLSEILRKKLNIQKPAFGAMPMMPAMGVGAPAAAASEAEPAEVKKEKTEFTVKLDGFSPDGKIKVIKEIRAITQLGLKEAKELVRCCRTCHCTCVLQCSPLKSSQQARWHQQWQYFICVTPGLRPCCCWLQLMLAKPQQTVSRWQETYSSSYCQTSAASPSSTTHLCAVICIVRWTRHPLW